MISFRNMSVAALSVLLMASPVLAESGRESGVSARGARAAALRRERSPQFRAAQEQLREARLNVSFVRRSILAELRQTEAFQEMVQEKRAQEARLAGLRADPNTTQADLLTAANKLLTLRTALSRAEADALAEDLEYEEVKAELADATQRVNAIRRGDPPPTPSRAAPLTTDALASRPIDEATPKRAPDEFDPGTREQLVGFDVNE